MNFKSRFYCHCNSLIFLQSYGFERQTCEDNEVNGLSFLLKRVLPVIQKSQDFLLCSVVSPLLSVCVFLSYISRTECTCRQKVPVPAGESLNLEQTQKSVPEILCCLMSMRLRQIVALIEPKLKRGGVPSENNEETTMSVFPNMGL